MRLIEALTEHPTVRIFAVLDSDSEDKCDWRVEPICGDVLTESESNDFFIVQAKNVLPDETVNDCYIDIHLPERISDYAYFLRGNSLDVRYHHEFDGEIICAVPIDCFGVYELFYSRTAPHIGIDILEQGLAASPHRSFIAEDLGYILRDEGRFREAAEMFQISVDTEPSSYFIYGELAGCYDEIGEAEKARKYHDMCQDFS
ncbi:MAG: tetratricopeptide repeat protein [Planctomycetota bacterium]|jgi:tetratricopeptide (TPR) repeat protein